jgi:Serine aminopeptidase, S33
VVKFILVHGTFAKHANWPALSTGLTEVCTRQGVDVEFVDVDWTGKNSIVARQLAAAQILVALMTAKEANPEEPVFALGHSHGGSALAYFLKEYPAAGAQLTGTAFLSTPFVAIRPRVGASSMMASTLSILMLAYQTVVTAIDPPLSSFNPIEVWLSYGWRQIAVLLAPILPSAFLIVTTIIAEYKMHDIVKNQSVDLPNGNHLFLRFTGDEAAALLSATQFAAWAALKIGQSVRYLLGSNRASRIVRGLYNTAATLAFMFSCTVVFNIIKLSVQYGFLNVLFRELDWYGSGFSRLDPTDIAIIVILVASCLLFLVFAFASATALFVFLWQAISARAFGWTHLFSGFAIELAIEPLPIGDHKLFVIDWSSDAAGLDGLVHSWTYSHPLAIAHIKEWVTASLPNATVAAEQSSPQATAS